MNEIDADRGGGFFQGEPVAIDRGVLVRIGGGVGREAFAKCERSCEETKEADAEQRLFIAECHWVVVVVVRGGCHS